jgi:hypothetical protein
MMKNELMDTKKEAAIGEIKFPGKNLIRIGYNGGQVVLTRCA